MNLGHFPVSIIPQITLLLCIIVLYNVHTDNLNTFCHSEDYVQILCIIAHAHICTLFIPHLCTCTDIMVILHHFTCTDIMDILHQCTGTDIQGWASILFKRAEQSLRSFPFFTKEPNDLCVLFRSL